MLMFFVRPTTWVEERHRESQSVFGDERVAKFCLKRNLQQISNYSSRTREVKGDEGKFTDSFLFYIVPYKVLCAVSSSVDLSANKPSTRQMIIRLWKYSSLLNFNEGAKTRWLFPFNP